MSLVTTLLDALDVAACVVGPRGRELHRSPRLRALLAAEPAADAILSEMRRFAGELLARRATPPARVAARGARTLAGAHDRYHAHAVALPAGAVGASPCVVVELAPRVPPLPAPEVLVERCGLTPREAEVALLLARGGSDREIAGQLGVSPHTVRKHTEHIFDKLRLHSRKAIVLELSAAARGMPRRSPPSRPRARATALP
ncbi:MAG TPA: helix-turn-helix transcriptional regulator [Gemmatimonadaceae bacterium]